MLKSISVDTVRSILSCDFSSGKLTWLYRDRNMFTSDRVFNSWNTKYCGKEAFTHTGSHGYKLGGMFGTVYKAHRVIWSMYTGYWPKELIDHINGNKIDNRIENLRESGYLGNAQNNMGRERVSIFKGVSWHKRVLKWQAQIRSNNKTVYLGYYDSEIEAHRAYCRASEELHGEFSNFGTPCLTKIQNPAHSDLVAAQKPPPNDQ